MTMDRRTFAEKLALYTGGLVLLPRVSGCKTSPDSTRPASVAPADDRIAIPWTKPAGWNALAFNRKRGDAGAIPASYLADIHGVDGDKKHLGKHLPYIPVAGRGRTVPGYIALM